MAVNEEPWENGAVGSRALGGQAYSEPCLLLGKNNISEHLHTCH